MHSKLHMHLSPRCRARTRTGTPCRSPGTNLHLVLMSCDVPSVTILMYFVLPVWFIAGFADWICHRATSIETASGVKESAIHALMMTEIPVPLVLTLLCEVIPLLLGISATTAGLHEAAVIGDVRSANDGGCEVRRPSSTFTASWRSGL